MSSSHATTANASVADLEKGTQNTPPQTGHNAPQHDTRLYPPFGGELRVAPYSPPQTDNFRKFANPGPLGLSSFALTTFVLSLINLKTRGVESPHVVVGLAFGYGGLVQLLAGMWEMASGNTFAATALSSYGGFWFSWAIIHTPFFETRSFYSSASEWQDALGYYLMGWFIFTFILLLCTMRSTVAFFSLFLTLDIAFLCLSVSHLVHDNGVAHLGLTKAGGVFGLLAAFLAWYNAYAGIEDRTNSFVHVKVMHFPWSEKARLERQRSHAD